MSKPAAALVRSDGMLSAVIHPTRFAGGISAMVVDLHGGTRIIAHRHDLVTIVAVLDGAVLERRHVPQAGRWSATRKGMISVVARHSLRDLETEADGARVALFTVSEAQPVARQPLARRSMLLRDDVAGTDLLMSLLTTPIAKPATPFAANVNESLESALIGLFRDADDSRVIRSRPAWLDHVCEAMESGPCPSRTSTLARQAGCHPVVMAREFRRWQGVGLQEFARRTRLRHALAMLEDGSAPLGSIALDTGFSDQSHFTRAFRDRYGVSPGQYRGGTRPRPVSSVQDGAFPGSHVGDVHTMDAPDSCNTSRTVPTSRAVSAH